MIRNIVKIDEEKCNGCGLCANACHEGAIKMIDGKAKLISDEYCDGLGDCLPACPTGAIEIIKREAKDYSEEMVQELKTKKVAHAGKGNEANNAVSSVKESNEHKIPCGCPGTMARKIQKDIDACNTEDQDITSDNAKAPSLDSQLSQWPVQLKLVNPNADYFNDADLLVAADCVAYAYGNFHNDFIKGRTVVIGCPKLDDNEFYTEKLTEILKNNNIKSITVVRMEVPCCGGIVSAVKRAMLNSEVIVPYREVTVSLQGKIR